jgi:hypothetical protein
MLPSRFLRGSLDFGCAEFWVQVWPSVRSLALCSWLLKIMLAFASLVAAICRLFVAPLKLQLGFLLYLCCWSRPAFLFCL